MDFDAEIELMYARFGRDVDRDLLPHIASLMADVHCAATHEFELRISRWGDITPENKKFILRD